MLLSRWYYFAAGLLYLHPGSARNPRSSRCSLKYVLFRKYHYVNVDCHIGVGRLLKIRQTIWICSLYVEEKKQSRLRQSVHCFRCRQRLQRHDGNSRLLCAWCRTEGLMIWLVMMVLILITAKWSWECCQGCSFFFQSHLVTRRCRCGGRPLLVFCLFLCMCVGVSSA